MSGSCSFTTSRSVTAPVWAAGKIRSPTLRPGGPPWQSCPAGTIISCSLRQTSEAPYVGGDGRGPHGHAGSCCCPHLRCGVLHLAVVAVRGQELRVDAALIAAAPVTADDHVRGA